MLLSVIKSRFSIPVIRRIPVILATGFRSSCQLLSVTGRFGPIPVRTPGRFGPIPFRSGRFGPILEVGRFGPILVGRFGPLYFI